MEHVRRLEPVAGDAEDERLVARNVAGLRGETPEAVGAAAKRNFERLFRRA